MSKLSMILAAVAASAIALSPVSAEAAARRANGGASKYSNNQRLMFGARYHQLHTVLKNWPYADGDISYGAFYGINDGFGYIEVGCEYMPKSKEDDWFVDSVITPRLNIAIKDGIFVAGVGISSDYVSYNEDVPDYEGKFRDDDWTVIHYQLHLGLDFELGWFTIDGGAFYTFEKWGELKDFDVDDLEYGIRIGFLF